MAFFSKIISTNGVIGIWKLEESPLQLLPQVRLSPQEILDYQKIKYPARQSEFLATRILYQQISKLETEIGYHASGKPFLPQRSENISVSHSRDFVCIYISEKNIGIDVEQADRMIDRVADRFLHPDEKQYIDALSNPQLAKIVYWSAKEAIFKSSEKQGIQFNTQIRIHPFNPSSELMFSAELHFHDEIINYSLNLERIENNVLVYCVED